MNTVRQSMKNLVMIMIKEQTDRLLPIQNQIKLIQFISDCKSDVIDIKIVSELIKQLLMEIRTYDGYQHDYDRRKLQ
jgi:hypothetical protein